VTAERVYRPLLRCYPVGYRAERGDEILDTALQGGDRPRLREARSLILGGLRVRAEQNRRLPARTNWRLGLLFGVSTWLAATAANGVAGSVRIFPNRRPIFFAPATASDWHYLIVSGLVLVVVVLVWVAPRRWVTVAAAVTTLAAVVPLYTDGRLYSDGPWRWQSLAVVACGLLARGAHRMPRAWLPIPVALAAIATVPSWVMSMSGDAVERWEIGTSLVVLASCLVWLVVDGRPALGLAAYTLVALLFEVVRDIDYGIIGRPVVVFGLPAVIAIGLLTPAVWRLRRQSRL
jgi:hypothetical protein